MFKNLRAIKVRRLILYFSFPILFLTCKENGSIGGGFIDESKIETDTLYITESSFKNANSLTGRLTFSPIGYFADPLFGEINAVGYFKPSITKNSSDTLKIDDQIFLNLSVHPDNIYGNQSSNGTFKIYRIGEFWRGSSITMNDNLEILNDMAEPTDSIEIATFNFSDIDTTGFIDIPLEGSWKSDFVRYYNNDENNRDSTYKHEDFGLVIVPENDVDKIVYTKFSSSRIISIDQNQDTTINTMFDWAYDIDINNVNAPEGNITLSNTFNPYMIVNLHPLAENLSNNNIIRAELVLTPDSTTISTSLIDNQIRTENPPFRVQLGPSNDIAYDLGFNTTNSKGIITDGIYKFDLTGLFNAYLFGDTDISEIYLYAGQNQGYLGFNTFFGFDADETAVPKVLIYYLEEAE